MERIKMKIVTNVWWGQSLSDAAVPMTTQLIEIRSGYLLETINPATDFRFSEDSQSGKYPFEFKVKKLSFKMDDLFIYNLKLKDEEVYQIRLTWLQNQKFMWMQNLHTFQNKKTIQYWINIFFLILGTFALFKEEIKYLLTLIMSDK